MGSTGTFTSRHVCLFLTIFQLKNKYWATPKRLARYFAYCLLLFESVSMGPSLIDNCFDQTNIAVQANIERKNNLGTWKISSNNFSSGGTSENLVDRNKFSRNNNNKSRVRGFCIGLTNRRREEGKYQHSSKHSCTCHYSGKPGHFIKIFRLCTAEEASGRIRKPNYQHIQSNKIEDYHHQSN